MPGGIGGGGGGERLNRRGDVGEGRGVRGGRLWRGGGSLGGTDVEKVEEG